MPVGVVRSAFNGNHLRVGHSAIGASTRDTFPDKPRLAADTTHRRSVRLHATFFRKQGHPRATPSNGSTRSVEVRVSGRQALAR